MTTLALPFTLTFGHIFMLALAIIVAISLARLVISLVVGLATLVFGAISFVLLFIVGMIVQLFSFGKPKRRNRR